MEGLIQKPQKLEIKPSREGEESLVFLERMKCPQIKEKFINFILECDKKERGTRIFITTEGIRKELEPPTKEELEKRYDDSLFQIQNSTEISFEGEDQQPDHSTLNLDFLWPDSGEKFTQRQWSIVEAHEKGHNLRYCDLFWREAKKIIRECFDFRFAKLQFGEEELKKFNFFYKSNKSLKYASKNVSEYLFSPMEIIERMSQIKNYFGMSGDEIFTREHLVYARENYVKDTGLDNWMVLFFKSIKPEKEDRFVEIMNTVGI